MNASASETINQIDKGKPASSKGKDREKDMPSIEQPEEEPNNVDQVIYLKDFPQSAQDLQTMINFGLDRIHGIYLIEELFSREFDAEEEERQEQTLKESTGYQDQENAVSGNEQKVDEEPPTQTEKLSNSRKERAQVFEELVQMNRILRR